MGEFFGSLSAAIESLHGMGLTPKEIAAQAGCTQRYAQDVIRRAAIARETGSRCNKFRAKLPSDMPVWPAYDDFALLYDDRTYEDDAGAAARPFRPVRISASVTCAGACGEAMS